MTRTNKKRRIKKFREKEQFWSLNAPHNKQVEIPTNLTSVQFHIESHPFHSFLPNPIKTAYETCVHQDNVSESFCEDLWTVLYLKTLRCTRIS